MLARLFATDQTVRSSPPGAAASRASGWQARGAGGACVAAACAPGAACLLLTDPDALATQPTTSPVSTLWGFFGDAEHLYYPQYPCESGPVPDNLVSGAGVQSAQSACACVRVGCGVACCARGCPMRPRRCSAVAQTPWSWLAQGYHEKTCTVRYSPVMESWNVDGGAE